MVPSHIRWTNLSHSKRSCRLRYLEISLVSDPTVSPRVFFRPTSGLLHELNGDFFKQNGCSNKERQTNQQGMKQSTDPKQEAGKSCDSNTTKYTVKLSASRPAVNGPGSLLATQTAVNERVTLGLLHIIQCSLLECGRILGHCAGPVNGPVIDNQSGQETRHAKMPRNIKRFS